MLGQGFPDTASALWREKLPPFVTASPLQQSDIAGYAKSQLVEFKRIFGIWCGWRGSNPRPLASEANTLSTELQPHG